MPIRINLLAEAQEIEDLRRRDPVKRAIWIGAGVVACVLIWSSKLQMQYMIEKGELTKIEGHIAAQTNAYHQVQSNEKKLREVNRKLACLEQLATNRFLNGTLLNALQRATVDDVELIHLKTEHTYTQIEEVKAKTNAVSGRLVPGKPAEVNEKLLVTLDARDISASPGDLVAKYKAALSDCGYFQNALGKTNEVRLATYSPPQPGPDSRMSVQFTLECRYPEKTRTAIP